MSIPYEVCSLKVGSPWALLPWTKEMYGHIDDHALKRAAENFLAVQWLELYASSVEGPDSVTGWGAKIHTSCMVWSKQKN